jgi:hypothetical protein
LGWCVHKNSERKARQLCLQNKIVEIMEDYLLLFRYNSDIVNSISFLKSKMKKYIPVTKVKNEFKTLFQEFEKSTKIDAEESSDDSDEE